MSTPTDPVLARRSGRRILRLAALVVGVLAALLGSSSAAFAQLPPPDHNAATPPTVIEVATTQPSPSTGLALWAVVAVAVTAVALGAGLMQLVHAARRSEREPSLAGA